MPRKNREWYTVDCLTKQRVPNDGTVPQFFMVAKLIIKSAEKIQKNIKKFEQMFNYRLTPFIKTNILSLGRMNDCSIVQMKSSRRGDSMTEKLISIERCESNAIHEDIINQVRDKMPQQESLSDLAELFKVFGDLTRIRILWALHEAEMCVCDIAVLLNMTQSAISHQLRVLKQANLVKNRKEGKVVYYSLVDDHVRVIFDQGLIHSSEK